MMYVAEVMRTFHSLSACDRIDLVCRILRHCTHYEAKFVGHVMADVSASQVKENPALEGNVNKTNYYAVFRETGVTHDVCEKLCYALTLLHPDNRPVAEVLFNLLDDRRVLTLFRDTSDLSVLDDYRLLYVMAVNHPVLSFGQRYHLMHMYLQAMDVLYSAKVKSDAEVTSSSPMEVEKIDGAPERHEAQVSSTSETVLFPEVSPDSYVTRVDVHGVYERPNKRFSYIIQVEWSDGTSYAIRRTYGDFFTFQNKLLDLFPEESGQKNKKQRIIPYLPGKKIITNKSSRQLAEKRLPELAKYAKELVVLPLYMLCSAHVLEFFRPRACDRTEAFPPIDKITHLQDLQQETGKTRQSSDSTWPSPSSGQDSPPRPDVGVERTSKTLPFLSTNAPMAAATGGNESAKAGNSPLERRFTYPARQIKPNGFATPENAPSKNFCGPAEATATVSPQHSSVGSQSPCPCLLPNDQYITIHSTTNITCPSPSQPLSPVHTLTAAKDLLSSSHQHIPSGFTLAPPPHPQASSTSMPDLSMDCTNYHGSISSANYAPQYVHSTTPGPSVYNQGAVTRHPGVGACNPILVPAPFPPVSAPVSNVGNIVPSVPTCPPLESSRTTSIAPHPVPLASKGATSSHSLHHPLPADAPSRDHASNLPAVTSSSVSMAASSLVAPSLVSSAPPSSNAQVVSTAADSPSVHQPEDAMSPQDSSPNELCGHSLLHQIKSSSSIPNISVFSYGSPLPSPMTSSPNTPYLAGSTGSVAQDTDSLPKWLKRHRLHKYAKLFDGMTFEEMQVLTEENLKEKGMTAGAAKKLRLKLDELGRFSFSGHQQESMKSSTCSLPAAIHAGRGLVHSSSCNQLTPHSSTSSLDQSNETSSVVAHPLSSPLKDHHHHHHHHRRAESLGVLPVLTDAAIVKVVQGECTQKTSGEAAPSTGGSQDSALSTNLPATAPEMSHSSQDSGISRTSVSADGCTSWADQCLTSTSDSDVCIPAWAQLHRSSPNIAGDYPQNASPVLSHSCPPLPPPPHLHHSHSSNFLHHPSHSTQHSTFAPVLGGRHHTPVQKRHSSDPPSAEAAVHPIGIHLIHPMIPPPPPSHAHISFNSNSWQAIRPIIVPGAMQLPRGPPRGGQVPILANGLMACPSPMQHMARVPIVFTGCMMPHPPVAHGRTTQNMTCFNCGKKGHLGNSCPNGNANIHSTFQAIHHDATKIRQSTTTAKDHHYQ